MSRVIIIGAGVTGLACGRHLLAAGLSPVLLDKGRGVGGRVATRRSGALQFDHGAQYVSARSPAFAALLEGFCQDGILASWDAGLGDAQQVGTPGMSALAKGLAVGLDIRQSAEVLRVRRDGAGWRIDTAERSFAADQVVMTAPPRQTAAMLGPEEPLSAIAAGIMMEPCLTLMAALRGPVPAAGRLAAEDALAWIARDDSKPGRPRGDTSTWVAQASATFSTAHLEATPQEALALLTPLFCARLSVSADQVVHAETHRWRYARAAAPLGEAFLRSAQGGLYVGGDWCLGQRIEDAWTSGAAIAEDLLARS
jgi:hypothetical protein